MNAPIISFMESCEISEESTCEQQLVAATGKVKPALLLGI
jgi:hypothetical protein